MLLSVLHSAGSPEQEPAWCASWLERSTKWSTSARLWMAGWGSAALGPLPGADVFLASGLSVMRSGAAGGVGEKCSIHCSISLLSLCACPLSQHSGVGLSEGLKRCCTASTITSSSLPLVRSNGASASSTCSFHSAVGQHGDMHSDTQ